MNVKFFDRDVLNLFFKIESAILALFSLVMGFSAPLLSSCWTWYLVYAGIFVLLTAITYLCIFIYAKFHAFLEMEINETKVNIRFGDIRKIEDGITVYNFNEYFDTIADDVIINKESLNGKFIQDHQNELDAIGEAIDKQIASDPEQIAEIGCTRKNGGRTTKCKLGTMVFYDRYALLAFTHFDEEDHAYLDSIEYTSCLMEMWKRLNDIYRQKPIYLTLAGGGVTRFKGNSAMEPQELLETMLWTLKMSQTRFSYPSSINIILRPDIKSRINFGEIKRIA